ncbi:MAG: type II secretion system protein GspM [Chromatiales bacterium]|jgi:general secretion pathway protein M
MTAWFLSLNKRDRKAVSTGIMIIAAVLFYLLVFEPLNHVLQEQRLRVESRNENLSNFRELVREYQSLDGKAENKHADENRSLISIIDQSSKSSLISQSIKRLTPEGEERVRVHFEEAEFNRVINWLIMNYEQNGVRAESLSLRETEMPGVVSGVVVMDR